MIALTLGQTLETDQLTVELTPLTESDVEALVAVEKLSYSHPWTLGNFRDAFKAGNLAQGLGYNARLTAWVNSEWSPQRAAERSPSLARARLRLNQVVGAFALP